MEGKVKRFGYSDGGAYRPPDFARGVAALSDGDLEDEILSGRGEPDYRAALVAEADRRGVSPPVPS